MGKKLKVKVNYSFHFDFTEEHILHFDAIHESKNSHHILEKKRSYKASLIKSDFNTRDYEIEGNCNTYQVTIANALDLRFYH